MARQQFMHPAKPSSDLSSSISFLYISKASSYFFSLNFLFASVTVNFVSAVTSTDGFAGNFALTIPFISVAFSFDDENSAVKDTSIESFSALGLFLMIFFTNLSVLSSVISLKSNSYAEPLFPIICPVSLNAFRLTIFPSVSKTISGCTTATGFVSFFTAFCTGI